MRLTSVTCRFSFLRGRDELAVGVLDNDNIAVDSVEDSRTGVCLAPSTTGTDKDVHDVEIFTSARDFRSSKKGKTALFLRLELNILLDLIAPSRHCPGQKEVAGSDESATPGLHAARRSRQRGQRGLISFFKIIWSSDEHSNVVLLRYRNNERRGLFTSCLIRPWATAFLSIGKKGP
jgi:hypothetical protein